MPLSSSPLLSQGRQHAGRPRHHLRQVSIWQAWTASVAPGDDFNAYANGGWIKATPIPADKASYGIFAILADETRKRLLALIQEAVQAGSAASGDTRKIADFYSSFMDEAAIESKGIAPLKPQLDTIAAIADRHALARVLGGQLRADVDPLNNTNFETDEPLRSLGHPGPDGPVTQLSVSAPGRSRNAGPRLLSLRNAAHG